ncbi:UDP-2,3-diacylglucosamine hydrolase [Pigmentiphaga humi]|uniref:UDP-2,3-diacylglucosamine hydrolase n=2 Tax=Pigmentiphaga humi TaxID=2478468 RepID=A0A3P4B3A7_9BURK|nr:UDP-2,3-diacylglucosamine hydrolase [Pigmentiphaga humi]
MHLSAESAATREAFLAFLQAAAEQASALLLPGDIFDAWVGDDEIEAGATWLQEIVEGLRGVSSRIPVYLGTGNRDFLMGERLAQATGTRRLIAPAVLGTDCGAFLLSHGDEFCTDDVAYQQFRAMVRNPQWQAQFLAQPLAARQALARQMRERSMAETSRKAADIMDVNQQAVEAALRAHGVTRMIHGHTHRPGRHVFELDGRPCERWVLPDWDLDDAGAPRGGWLAIDQDGAVFNDIEFG